MEIDSRVSQEASLPIGSETMSPAMAEMEAYPSYLFQKIEAHLGARVWEIGVGHGQYARLLLARNKKVMGTDIDRACLAKVEAAFQSNPAFESAWVDLNDRDSIDAIAKFEADSILCFNVLEHIEHDAEALSAIRQAVTPKATLCLIVPAHMGLMGKMDREAGHFRRYSRAMLANCFRESGWIAQHLCYINALGAAGWWYHNRWRKDAGLKDAQVNSQMKSIDRWLPRIAKWTDPWLGRCFGLSLVGIARAN